MTHMRSSPPALIVQVGVPRASYELCLEKKELIALLLVRPPLARSLLGVMCAPQRRSQFGAILEEQGDNKKGLLEFWLSVQSFRQMAVATIGDATSTVPSPLCSIPSILRAAKDIHREWFEVRGHYWSEAHCRLFLLVH